MDKEESGPAPLKHSASSGSDSEEKNKWGKNHESMISPSDLFTYLKVTIFKSMQNQNVKFSLKIIC